MEMSDEIKKRVACNVKMNWVIGRRRKRKENGENGSLYLL